MVGVGRFGKHLDIRMAWMTVNRMTTQSKQRDWVLMRLPELNTTPEFIPGLDFLIRIV